MPRAPSTTCAPFACHVQSRGALPFFTRFYVTSPIPLPAQPAQSLPAVASGERMLPARENFRSSKLAPVMMTTLSLIPDMKPCFPCENRSRTTLR
jgi:hypothetical protein